jgi:Leucine-rich repeat (LRR) protein
VQSHGTAGASCPTPPQKSNKTLILALLAIFVIMPIVVGGTIGIVLLLRDSGSEEPYVPAPPIDYARVDFSGRNITDSQLAEMVRNGEIRPDVRSLDLSNNQISDLSPLRTLTELSTLNVSENNVSDLSPLSGMTSITFLTMMSNQITDISPISGLNKLWLLNLGGNQISDISPLRNLTTIRVLSLTGNRITDISPLPLSGRSMEFVTLNLSNNRITDISPLRILEIDGNLHLSGNPITDWSPVAHVPEVYGRP